MNAPNVPMEAFINAGMGGVRANHWNDLLVDEGADAVAGKAVDLGDDEDAAWSGRRSW
jgi:hypothetical protein